jgi:GTPase SAR1 family protein
MFADPVRKKIVFVGPSESGKTQAVHTLIDSKDAVLKTIGCTHQSILVESSNGVSCRVNLWDCAGSKHYEALLPTGIKGADAVILFSNPYDEQCAQITCKWMSIQNDG